MSSIMRRRTEAQSLVWVVSFDLTHRKSYGHAASLDEAKAAFKAEYEVAEPGRLMLDFARGPPYPGPVLSLRAPPCVRGSLFEPTP